MPLSQNRIEEVAKLGHNALAYYKISLGEAEALWSEAEAWQKDSTRDLVKQAYAGTIPSPEIEHQRWFAERTGKGPKGGWRWGAVRNDDPGVKTNPLLTPTWAELPLKDRLKTLVEIAVVCETLGKPAPDGF